MQYSEAFLIVHQKQIGIHRFFKMKNMSKTKTPNKNIFQVFQILLTSHNWQVYDLVTEGLLGVRPLEDREALAFVERAAVGANLVRRLTGQEWFTEDFFFRWGEVFGDFLGDIFRMDSFGGCTFMYFYFKGKVRFLLDQHQHFKSLKSLRIDFLHFHSFWPRSFRSLAQICCQFVVLQLGDSRVSELSQLRCSNCHVSLACTMRSQCYTITGEIGADSDFRLRCIYRIHFWMRIFK